MTLDLPTSPYPLQILDAALNSMQPTLKCKWCIGALIGKQGLRLSGCLVVWLSDHTRPFVIVLIQASSVQPVLSPLAHLGIGCKSREAVDMLCDKARQAGLLLEEPKDSGYPIGYWAFLRDPDGHTLELSYGQEIGLTVTQES